MDSVYTNISSNKKQIIYDSHLLLINKKFLSKKKKKSRRESDIFWKKWKKKIDGAYCLGFSFKDLKTKDANFSYILLMR